MNKDSPHLLIIWFHACWFGAMSSVAIFNLVQLKIKQKLHLNVQD
jgi:hypothetical protein